MSISFEDRKNEPAIQGFLHEPERPIGFALALTHGAGANCQTKLLVEMSDAFWRGDSPFCVSTCPSAVRGRTDHRLQGALLRTERGSTTPWPYCERRRKAEYFWVAIPTVDARQRFSRRNNRS